MAIILDTGALISIEARHLPVQFLLRRARQRKQQVRVGAGVLAQVWRGGPRQANLVRVLVGVDVEPMDEGVAHRIGELLAVSGTRDVVDAHCALLVRDGDIVLTSDPSDIKRLLLARGVTAAVHRI